MIRATAFVVALLPAACAAQVAIRTDFEGACLGKVEKLSETSFLCRVPGQADREGRNRQVSWYFFRVDGARGKEVTVTLADLVGEYNYKPGAVAILPETIPFYSYDQKSWTPFDAVSYDRENHELTLRFTPREDSIWIAHVEPYTTVRLAGMLDEIRGRPHVRIETVGKSVRGRDLHLLTITNPEVPDTGKKVLWFMFRQHAWETGTSFVGEGLVRFAASDDPEARRLRDQAVLKVFPMLDPDGCAAGAVRFNQNGYDVNRNWDTCDLKSDEHRRLMPEIWHAKKAMLEWLDAGRPIHFFLTLHNEEKGEWISAPPESRDLALRFFARLKDTTTFDPSQEGPQFPKTGPIAPGRQSVYEYLQRERHVPAFLMEQRIIRGAKLGRQPVSADRLRFGRELFQAAAGAVLE